MLDVAIVGGGPAGLATAYFLRDNGLDVAVLEATDEVGGRTRSVEVGGLPSNTGALFVYTDTVSEELAYEFGIRTTLFTPTTYGIHVNGETVVDADNDRLIERLPIPAPARDQFRVFVHDALDQYRRYTEAGQLSEDAVELAGRTLADAFHGLAPEVVAIITAAVRGGSVADPSELSAQYALRYFASYLAHEQHNRLYPVDGMQSLPRAMAAALPANTVRLGQPVTEVARDGGAYVVRVAGGDEPIRARQVVLAVPAPVAGRIVPGLPDWKRDALAAARMPGVTTLCVTVDAAGDPQVSEWAFLATAGRVFDAIINPDPRPFGPDRPLVQFVCYGTSAGYRPDLMSSADAENAWVDEFLAVAPQLRGRVVGAHLQTWEHCFAISTPRRLAALPDLQRSVGGLHFAGDHTSHSAGSHGAYAEGRRVADLLLCPSTDAPR